MSGVLQGSVLGPLLFVIFINDMDDMVSQIDTLKKFADDNVGWAAKIAQTVLGQISRTFHYRDRHIFLRLYKQYVRPHLEFSTPAWAPWTEGDRNCLEKVQQRASKMVSGLKSNIYEERLSELNLPTLLERRHQADMVQFTPRERWVGTYYLVRES